MFGIDNEGNPIGVDSPDAKAVAAAKIEHLKAQSWALIEEAVKIADEHGLFFYYEPKQVGSYDGAEDGDGWYPSSWSSSSIGC